MNEKELDTTDLDFYVSHMGYGGYESALKRGSVRGIDPVDFVKASFLPGDVTSPDELHKREKVLSLIGELQVLSQSEGDEPDRVLLMLLRVPNEALPVFFDGLEKIIDSASPLKSADSLVARLIRESQGFATPIPLPQV